MLIPKIPYFQTTRYRVDTMVLLAEAKLGERGIDLGAGDGRIVSAFAKNGIEMHGYEIDKKLYQLAQETIVKEGLTAYAHMHEGDFWGVNLASFDFVTVYGMPDIMEVLEKKLQNELPPHARILSNYYPFPTLQLKKIKDHIYFYRITSKGTFHS